MWRKIFIGVLLICTSCMPETLQMRKNNGLIFRVDERSIEMSAEITTGESFTIDLRNPGSGGYLVRDPEFDSTILRLDNQKSIPPSGDEHKSGDFGRLIYTFKAIAQGNTGIAITIYRPWEKNMPEQDFVRMNVVVTR